MDQRTYESPMEWEYQDTGPMDQTSPFVAQSSKATQSQGNFSGSSGNTSGSSIFSQNGFGRAPITPSKLLPPTPLPMLPPSSSIFASSRAKTAPAAPSFRNPAFTTPRKPFDIDAMLEISPLESSPAATDGSDFPETPDHDQSLVISDITATPASVSAYKSPFAKKASGKGEISKALFPPRDKIRKRKWHTTDKDLGRYRLPYKQDGSDYESDESATQLNRSQSRRKKRRVDGWFGGFLTALQRHPYAPSILGYWLSFGFSLICVSGTVWIGWAILGGLREDFAVARASVRDEILDEMARCRSDYIDNKCFPIEKRLPAMYQLCEQWHACMNRNPDNLKKIQLGAKSIVEIINEIVDTMSYKTIALLIILLAVFLFSGRSLYKTAHDYPDFTRPAPGYNQPHHDEHAAPQHVYWQALQPRTPRRALRHVPADDETPESDVSPPKFKALPAPETPSGKRSPFKAERGRSPVKSRSPTKRY